MIKHHHPASRRRPAKMYVVEFAIVAPIFFLFLFGIFEYARLMFTWQLMNNACREGARYAVVNLTTASTANVQNYVDGYLVGQGGAELVGYNATSSISVYKADASTGGNTGGDWTTSKWGDGVGVSISGTYKPFTPGLLYLSPSLTMNSACVITVEAN